MINEIQYIASAAFFVVFVWVFYVWMRLPFALNRHLREIKENQRAIIEWLQDISSKK